MIAAADNIYLGSCLAPLAGHLAREEVTDIYINRPGELWVETADGRTERFCDGQLDDALMLRFARQVAALSGQGINRDSPLLAAALPSGERVQIALPPATRGDIAIAIRKHAVQPRALEDYCPPAGRCDPQGAPPDRTKQPARQTQHQDNPIAMLRAAVREKRNILVSGGTSSGKTTFLNALIREIAAEERLILIEDAPELQVSQENTVGLVAARGLGEQSPIEAEDLLIAALRMRPDRIILGEIRGREATTYLRAVNTGHPGSLSSIHADSPERAIDQLALLVLQTGIQMNWNDVVTYVRRSIDFIVQMGRTSGRRQIESVYCVD